MKTADSIIKVGLVVHNAMTAFNRRLSTIWPLRWIGSSSWRRSSSAWPISNLKSGRHLVVANPAAKVGAAMIVVICRFDTCFGSNTAPSGQKRKRMYL
ncbi:hypothetical protein DERF_010956 [Dermatophagoides farinae]|uniref:Uncharacterized protein n=1 Tax=Dermatophagoides farinae TaxID=6954 RepID=A0A922KYT7_DERFA|nr:hypothetical protein DERF_010956 [Dermatophagoides farinae]